MNPNLCEKVTKCSQGADAKASDSLIEILSFRTLSHSREKEKKLLQELEACFKPFKTSIFRRNIQFRK